VAWRGAGVGARRQTIKACPRSIAPARSLPIKRETGTPIRGAEPGGIIGQQVGHRASNVVGRAEATHGVPGRCLGFLSFVEGAGKLGLHDGRCYGVDTDSPGASSAASSWVR
jgi:hypothetical protein